MKILVAGGQGQLGTELKRSAEIVPDVMVRCASSADVDVRQVSSVREALRREKPDALVNAAAYNFVDRAETEEDAARAAFEINAFGPRNLAAACREAKIPLVHVSTNFVFDGRRRRPYRESDPPNPLSLYGVSKLAGELFVRRAWSKVAVVRTSGLYGRAESSRAKKNFVEQMLTLGPSKGEVSVVRDQILGPTYCRDLAEAILKLVGAHRHGVFHVTNEGSCSWADFAREIFRLAGLRVRVRPVKTSSLGAPDVRPAYTVLSQARWNALGLGPMRPWREALAAYLKDRAAVA
ncbi:MAG: dTDP-4-dehydrorhamnose reductase [Nitrospirae bacterium]|nr:dTDP-4-dehydrorhamnose reductase [Nitrospirota bacterium]